MDWRYVVAVGMLVGALLVGGSTHAQANTNPTTPETDHTVTRVTVEADGDARWTVRIRTHLPTEDSVSDFRAFQDRFRANTSAYLDPFARRITATVASAENTTGREMTATNFSASTSIQTVPRTWGVVTYRFTWTNFTAAREDRLVVADVFRSGFYVGENDTLAIAAPGSFEIRSASPDPDDVENGTARWTGPRDFPDERPRLVFEPADQSNATGTPVEGDASSPSSSPAGSRSASFGPLTALWTLLGAVALGGTVAYWYHRQSHPTEGSPTPQTPEQISDEERVTRLLRENGGQMRQADIVDAVDWSKSKTSRVLSSMADEGDVEKVRLGRENVVRLDGDDD